MIDTLWWMLVAAMLVPAHRAAYQQPRKVLAALVAVEGLAVAMILLATARPETYVGIAQEDGTVEWATFLAFVMAAGWLAVVVRKTSESWWFKGACLLLAVFCLVIAGEEISWGQRLLGFKPPDVFLERNFQQELNLHNVLMNERGLGFKLESKHLVSAIAIGFGFVWPALVHRPRFRVFAPLAPPIVLAPVFLGVVAALSSYGVELTGEGAELILGLLFLASAVVVTDLRARVAVAVLVAPLALGAMTSVVMTRVVFGSDEEGQRVAAEELGLLRADVMKGATEKLRKRSIHKRLYTATLDGYLRLAGGMYLAGGGTPAEPGAAVPRTDRRGYFLDPWNNPYWVEFDKRSKAGVIYSFGPNRRRDVDLEEDGGDRGDDLIVDFELEDRVDRPADDQPDE